MPTIFRHGHWIVDDQAGTRAQGSNAPASGTTSSPQYVITLSVTPRPLPLPAPSALPQIGGLTIFRARYPIANREVHLQQLGYFDTLDAARAFLPRIETEYPGAFVEQARVGTMTSLDDTTIAEFEVLRRAPTLPPIPPVAPPPVVHAPPAPEVRLPVHDTFKSSTAPQHYAIQLLRQSTPIDLARIPRPSIFQGYTLYRVQSERDGHRSFGLRLGFFTDAHSARLVAEYVKSQFPRCAAVPVSEREYARVESEPKSR